MKIARYKMDAQAGDNYPKVTLEKNVMLKRVEVLSTNATLTANPTLNMVWVKNDYDTEQSLHLDSKIILTDLGIWAWDGEIHLNVPSTIVASLSQSVLNDIIELVVCYEPDGERD